MSRRPSRAVRQRTVRFGNEKLSAGHAERCENQAEEATELVSYGVPRASMIRIVNPDSGMENPAGAIGEIWVHGDNVAMGYWRNPQLTRSDIRCETCQSVGWHAGGSMAANRGSGRHFRG